MAHPQDHQPGDRASRLMVLFSLGLFFAMTVVGHYVFVAGSAHHDAPPAATQNHAPH